MLLWICKSAAPLRRTTTDPTHVVLLLLQSVRLLEVPQPFLALGVEHGRRRAIEIFQLLPPEKHRPLGHGVEERLVVRRDDGRAGQSLQVRLQERDALEVLGF